MSNSNDILKKYWGYDSFRPNQASIIDSVLANTDTLALLPTGGGKSICFQVPALMMEGICIVITPLIALMQDQINGLAKRGIKALGLYSGMSAREIDITLDNAVYGNYSFLYVSPERLQTKIFIERFKKMKISFIAVDEAHCISQWGYDFRPAYLKISELRTLKKDISFLALTATATPRVSEDIQEKLLFKKNHTIKSSFIRVNLKYITLTTDNKLDDIISLIVKLKGSGIIYCSSRRNTKMLWQHLHKKGLSATFYHAGLDKDERKKRQDSWTKNETRIIISTNAFGMGIDKPDVRFVLHYDIPDNLESYFQEAGRAGRDLEKARAILFYDNNDLKLLTEKIDWKFPEISTIKSIYNALGNHFQLAIGSGNDSVFNLDLGAFTAKYNLNLYSTYSAIKLLESSGLIMMNDFAYLPSRLKILVNKTALYNYQVKDATHNKIIQFILRSHLGIFDEYLVVNESVIAKKNGISVAKVSETLTFLDKQQVVDYVPSSSGYQVTYLTERLADQNFSLPKEIYSAKKESAKVSVESMLDFLKNKECRQVFILGYFGEKNIQKCGQCNVCLNYQNITPPSQLITEIAEFISSNLNTDQLVSIDSIITAFTAYQPSTITHTIKWLSEQNKIKIDPSGRLVSPLLK